MADVRQLAQARGELAANIILVHGLTGKPLETWTTPKQELWPLWLAQDIEGIAVYSVGYDAPVSNAAGVTMHPTQIASNLLSRLLNSDELKQGRIIFIGHSLGGLIIKMMISTRPLGEGSR